MQRKNIIFYLSSCLFVFMSFLAVSDTIVFNEKSPANNREKFIIGIQILKVVKEKGKPFAIVENNQENVKKLNEAGVKSLPDKQNPNMLWVGDVKAVVFISDETMKKNTKVSKYKQIRSDMRSMATALEAYYIDNNKYPPCTTDPSQSASPQTTTSLGLPSFRIKNPKYSGMTLTTPLAYTTGWVPDQYAIHQNETFVYYSTNSGWILVSPGPDGRFDVNPMQDYSVNMSPPIHNLEVKAYDPTNGATSRGDIFRVKQ